MIQTSISNESLSITENPEIISKPKNITNNIEPINTEQMKELLRQKNKNEFIEIISDPPKNNYERVISPEDISSRDIIEFSIHTRIAHLVQQAQKVFLSKNYSNTQELQEELNRIIMNFQDVPDDTYRLTHSQNESQIKFFKEAINEIISRFNDFNEFIENADDEQIISKLGDNFKDLPLNKFRLDKYTYPGALVIHIKDKDTYNNFIDDKSLGKYAPFFGVDYLKGHVFVVNDEIHYGDTDEIIDTENHEYFHLLYRIIEPLTIQESDKIIAKAISAEEEISTFYRKKISQLKKKAKHYKSTSNLSSYRNILKEIEDTKETMAQMETIAYANIDSYEVLHIWKLYQTFKNEFFAYSSGNKKPSDFWEYIGDESIVDILEEESDGRAFLSELRGLKKILKIAFKRGHTPKELSYLIMGTRSVTQAQKFIYLHMQRDGTAHSSLDSKVSDIDDA